MRSDQRGKDQLDHSAWVSYTYSKALDDVGEFFFSAPIDNFNVWRDYWRSDDDQRHRLVFDGTIHSAAGAAHSKWERLSHGFQLSGILQYYSGLPFNLTTGSNTIQGTAARPTVNVRATLLPDFQDTIIELQFERIQ